MSLTKLNVLGATLEVDPEKCPFFEKDAVTTENCIQCLSQPCVKQEDEDWGNWEDPELWEENFE